MNKNFSSNTQNNNYNFSQSQQQQNQQQNFNNFSLNYQSTYNQPQQPFTEDFCFDLNVNYTNSNPFSNQQTHFSTNTTNTFYQAQNFSQAQFQQPDMYHQQQQAKFQPEHQQFQQHFSSFQQPTYQVPFNEMDLPQQTPCYPNQYEASYIDDRLYQTNFPSTEASDLSQIPNESPQVRNKQILKPKQQYSTTMTTAAGASDNIWKNPSVRKAAPKKSSTQKRSSPKKQNRSPKDKDLGANKSNLLKNFISASSSFARSLLAFPYVTDQLREQRYQFLQFQNFIDDQKKKMQSFNTFREVLIPNGDDSEKIVLFKELLKKLTEVFLKYFSVNWIFSSKLQEKSRMAHLKFRYQFLKKIKNIENETSP